MYITLKYVIDIAIENIKRKNLFIAPYRIDWQ